MKKLLIFSLMFILLVGSVYALSLEPIFISDSKLTKIYTSSLCSFSTKCDENTLTEIDVDFERDSKTGAIMVDSPGIKRIKELAIYK